MSKVFNIKKFAQQIDSSMGRQDVTEVPASTSDNNAPLLMDQGYENGSASDISITLPKFQNGSELFEFLEAFRTQQGDAASAYDAAWNGFFANRLAGSANASSFEDGLRRFYEQQDNSNEATKVAMDLFDIYSSMINPNVQPIMAENKIASIVDDVLDSTDAIISSMAKSIVKSSSSTNFNLSKFAQHKSIVNSVVMSGPSQVSMSPFTRDLQSSMHLVEQNKGFGLRIGDILDIDFEAIWRGNVMDKYYRATRNKDGIYGGGYIDDKFEVNRFIPVGNDYQLPPGVRHRPYIPEHGLLEARMEVARGNKDRLSDPRKFANVYNHSLSKKKV